MSFSIAGCLAHGSEPLRLHCPSYACWHHLSLLLAFPLPCGHDRTRLRECRQVMKSFLSACNGAATHGGCEIPWPFLAGKLPHKRRVTSEDGPRSPESASMLSPCQPIPPKNLGSDNFTPYIQKGRPPENTVKQGVSDTPPP